MPLATNNYHDRLYINGALLFEICWTFIRHYQYWCLSECCG